VAISFAGEREALSVYCVMYSGSVQSFVNHLYCDSDPFHAFGGG